MAKSSKDPRPKREISKAQLVNYKDKNPDKPLSGAFNWGTPKKAAPAAEGMKYKYTGQGAVKGAKKLPKASTSNPAVSRAQKRKK